jgi:hypothetical protein
MKEFRLIIQEVNIRNNRKFYGKSKSFSFLSNENLEETFNDFNKRLKHNSPREIRQEKLERIRKALKKW